MTDHLTPNRLVAANLRRAREEKGWSQEKAGKELAAHLGEEWSKARWSSAERADDPETVRGFSADELVAFSRTFGRPVIWFLMPPVEEDADSLPDRIAGLPINEYLDLLYVPDLAGMAERVVALSDLLGWDLRARQRAAMTPIWARAMSDIAGDFMALYLDMAAIAKKIEARYEELREAAFGVVDTDEPELTDIERDQVDASQRLDALDEAAESIDPEDIETKENEERGEQ